MQSAFAEFDASVQGWINHVRYADSWGLRRHVLEPFVLSPGTCRANSALLRAACHSENIAATIVATRDMEQIAMAEPSPLDLLMQMVQKVLDGQKDIREDVREIKTRLGRLETDVAQLHVYMAEQSTRLDRLSDRLERVERRLEIVET